MNTRRTWDYTNEILFADMITRRRAREIHTSHRKRIRESQPVVDCAPPSTYGLLVGHSHNFQAKKHQIIQDRLLQIYLENVRLAQSMAHISNHCYGRRSRLTTVICSSRHQPPLSKGDALYRKTSLNELERRKENVRIAKDNKLMKER
jgi:hypothetical protein